MLAVSRVFVDTNILHVYEYHSELWEMGDVGCILATVYLTLYS